MIFSSNHFLKSSIILAESANNILTVDYKFLPLSLMIVTRDLNVLKQKVNKKKNNSAGVTVGQKSKENCLRVQKT